MRDIQDVDRRVIQITHHPDIVKNICLVLKRRPAQILRQRVDRIDRFDLVRFFLQRRDADLVSCIPIHVERIQIERQLRVVIICLRGVREQFFDVIVRLHIHVVHCAADAIALRDLKRSEIILVDGKKEIVFEIRRRRLRCHVAVQKTAEPGRPRRIIDIRVRLSFRGMFRSAGSCADRGSLRRAARPGEQRVLRKVFRRFRRRFRHGFRVPAAREHGHDKNGRQQKAERSAHRCPVSGHFMFHRIFLLLTDQYWDAQHQ